MANFSTFIKSIRDIMRKDAGINGDAQRIEQLAWILFLKLYRVKEKNWEIEDDDYYSIIPDEYKWDNWAKNSNLTDVALLKFINDGLFPGLRDLKIRGEEPKKAVVQKVFADSNNFMKDGVLLRQVIDEVDKLELEKYDDQHAFGEIYETLLRELQSAGSSGEFYTPRAVTDFMAKMIQPQVGERCADFACGTGGFLKSWLAELDKKSKKGKDSEQRGKSIYGIEKKQFPFILCVINMILQGVDRPEIMHENSLTLNRVTDYKEEDQFDVVLMNPPYGGKETDGIKSFFPKDVASSETADLFMSVIMYRLKKTGRAAVIIPDGFLFGTDNAKVAIKKKLTSNFNLHTIIRMPRSVFAPYTPIATNILFFDAGKPTTSTWFYRLDMPEGYKNFSKTKPMKLEHFQPAIEWWNDRQELVLDGFDKAKEYPIAEIIERNYNLDLCGYPHEEEEILPPKELIQQYQEKRASLNADIDRILAEITEILGLELEEN